MRRHGSLLKLLPSKKTQTNLDIEIRRGPFQSFLFQFPATQGEGRPPVVSIGLNVKVLGQREKKSANAYKAKDADGT